MTPNNPMTEGEALAVLRELRDTGDVSDWQAMESALTMAMDRLTAHTAASGGEVAERVAVLTAHRACHAAEHDPANGRLHGYCIVCGVPFPCDYVGEPPAKRPPPAAVPADALERLVAQWRENESTCVLRAYTIRHECADELSALIPKGADHGG